MKSFIIILIVSIIFFIFGFMVGVYSESFNSLDLSKRNDDANEIYNEENADNQYIGTYRATVTYNSSIYSGQEHVICLMKDNKCLDDGLEGTWYYKDGTIFMELPGYDYINGKQELTTQTRKAIVVDKGIYAGRFYEKVN